MAGRTDDDFGSRYLAIKSEIGIGIIRHLFTLPSQSKLFISDQIDLREHNFVRVQLWSQGIWMTQLFGYSAKIFRVDPDRSAVPIRPFQVW